MEVKDIIENGGDYFLPNLSIDMVIIGYEKNELKCLLLKIADKWVLPGGYIENNENVDDAVHRILEARAGFKTPHLRFLSVFGNKDRNFKDQFKKFFKERNLDWRDDYWITNRFVTLAYYSLVDIQKVDPSPGEFDEDIQWFSFDQLPPLWLDHEEIILTAKRKLKEDVKHELVTYNLLPKDFTMPQLHQLHQTILEEEIDRSRFQKKMLSSGVFERLPQLRKETPGRNPYLYRLKTN